jgi:hypothetical protein
MISMMRWWELAPLKGRMNQCFELIDFTAELVYSVFGTGPFELLKDESDVSKNGWVY